LQRSGDCYKGSCRSVPGINIFDLLSSVSHTLLHFGGHCAAAGLSVHADQLVEFKESVQNKLEQSYVLADLVPSIVCAAPLFLDEITSKLARDLALMEPFGAGNERPIFYIAHVQLVGELQLLKDEHVKCFITDRGIIKPVIFFNRPELYDWLSQRKNADFDVAAYVQENTYRGRTTIDLQGVDIRVSGEGI
jgi:single-stranded-DNA-specific exonuclease